MLRTRLRADDGFTLVELLVVILIIGILAATGLTAFLGQRSKAQDAGAKSATVTAAKAIAAYGTDHRGFTDADAAALADIERSLAQARNLTVTADEKTFTVSVDSAADAGASFSIRQSADGTQQRDCSLPGTGGCRDDLDAHGDRW